MFSGFTDHRLTEENSRSRGFYPGGLKGNVRAIEVERLSCTFAVLNRHNRQAFHIFLFIGQGFEILYFDRRIYGNSMGRIPRTMPLSRELQVLLILLCAIPRQPGSAKEGNASTSLDQQL